MPARLRCPQSCGPRSGYTMKILSAYLGLQTNGLPLAYEDSNQALEAAQEESGRIDHVGLALHFRGLILAKMKRFEEARVTAEKLRECIEKSEVPNDLRHYHRLMGEIAREEGDLTKAVGSFETSVKLLPEQNYKYRPPYPLSRFPGFGLFSKGRLGQGSKKLRANHHPDDRKVEMGRPLFQELLLAGKNLSGAESARKSGRVLSTVSRNLEPGRPGTPGDQRCPEVLSALDPQPPL